MALTTFSNTTQTVNTGSAVVFTTNYNSNSCTVRHSAGSSAISLHRAGWYLVDFTATASTVATAGGTATFHLYGNDTQIEGFEASQSATADTVIMNLSQSQFMVRVSPNCCAVTNNIPLNLTIQNDGTPVTITNANVTVTKLS